MRHIPTIAAILALITLCLIGDADAQRTGGSFGASSWGSRGSSSSSSTSTRSSSFSRPSTAFRPSSSSWSRPAYSAPRTRVGPVTRTVFRTSAVPTPRTTVVVVPSHPVFHHDHHDDHGVMVPLGWDGDDNDLTDDSGSMDGAGHECGIVTGIILAAVAALLFGHVWRSSRNRGGW